MLVLARHGQTEANAAGLLVGRAESPLTELGCRQADAIGAALAQRVRRSGVPVARVVSSPIGRAVDTAGRIRAALLAGAGVGDDGELAPGAVEVDDRLAELDYGELDLVPIGDVGGDSWRAWQADSHWRPPGGETLEELAGRVAGLLTELLPAAAGADADVVLVSHVSPIKAVIAHVLGVGIETSWRLSLGVASLSRIGLGTAGPVLVSFNETGHLAGL